MLIALSIASIMVGFICSLGAVSWWVYYRGVIKFVNHEENSVYHDFIEVHHGGVKRLRKKALIWSALGTTFLSVGVTLMAHIL